MVKYQIQPQATAGSISIDLTEVNANVATCRLFLRHPDHTNTELTNPAGNQLPFSVTLPNPAESYKGDVVDCFSLVSDGNNPIQPGDTYHVKMVVKQTPAQSQDNCIGQFEDSPHPCRTTIWLV